MPNWYQENLKKHWKDYSKRVLMSLWHCSPDKITSPSAKSVFKGINGIYFSPSYNGAVRDWANWVRDKKLFLDDLSRRKDEVFKKQLEKENKYFLEELESDDEYIKIREELNRINDILINEKYTKSHKPYDFIWISKFIFPRWAFDEINKWFHSFMEYDKDGLPKQIGFWAWGDQIFIPEKYFRYLKFVSTNKLTKKQILNKI